MSKRVLILEDQHALIDAFCCRLRALMPNVRVFYTNNPHVCVTMLQEDKYDVVSLDYDLGHVGDTGMIVVDYLCGLCIDERPKYVCVHSSNVVMGSEMCYKLTQASYQVVKSTLYDLVVFMKDEFSK